MVVFGTDTLGVNRELIFRKTLNKARISGARNFRKIFNVMRRIENCWKRWGGKLLLSGNVRLKMK
jgi:hypothetical protein